MPYNGEGEDDNEKKINIHTRLYTYRDSNSHRNYDFCHTCNRHGLS